jgi:multimeric flavodoxin WrbA
MPTLLVVHHTVSPPLDEILQCVLAGGRDDAIEGVDVVVRAALSATVPDVLAADGYLLGTPANLGYMSGALKHFFDTIYYPCLEETRGRRYGLWVHGNNDTTGAVAAVERIATGLGWEPASRPLTVTGPVDRAVREAAHELGGTLAATLAA